MSQIQSIRSSRANSPAPSQRSNNFVSLDGVLKSPGTVTRTPERNDGAPAQRRPRKLETVRIEAPEHQNPIKTDDGQASTTQPLVRRKPRKLNRAPEPLQSPRSESSGGVAITSPSPRASIETNGGVAITSVSVKAATTANLVVSSTEDNAIGVRDGEEKESKDKAEEDGQNAAEQQKLQRPDVEQPPARRRPRKLNRNRSANAMSGPQAVPTGPQVNEVVAATPQAIPPTPVAIPPISAVPRGTEVETKSIQPQEDKTDEGPINTEIEALKERVRGLESQVQELYLRPPQPPGRSPRRRGKGRRGGQATPEEQSEQLVRLQEELLVAQNELATLRSRAASSNGSPYPQRGVPTNQRRNGNVTNSRRARPAQTQDTDDEVEEIRRTSVPGVVGASEGPQRAVSLSGNYKIRLPENLNINDVRAIQDGVTSVGNIARTIAAKRGPKTNRPSGDEIPRDGGKQSWSSWIGSYSQSISRMIQENVEADAAVESTPVAAGIQHPAGGRPRKLPTRGRTRPAGGSRNMSSPAAPQSNALIARSTRPEAGAASSNIPASASGVTTPMVEELMM